MGKAGATAFLLSAAIVASRIIVGDQRRIFHLPPESPLWVSYLLRFVILFLFFFLLSWRAQLRKARRERKEMEKYMEEQSR